MEFSCCIYLILYVLLNFCFTYTDGTCQCNQMLPPGVFSGEKMTFIAEGNRNVDKRSENEGKQGVPMGVISFDPPYLDFGEQPIGMPYVRDVSVLNPRNEKDLMLQALSGDNVHFHVSLPKQKVISPMTNTSIEIIFLARSLGSVEHTLFIHTSIGAYPYQVRGVGIQNPYRLHPFLGTRISLDHIFSSVMNMYNPHPTTLQVTEIYSSGGDLHLELPAGEVDASHKHWQIQPFETKAVIKLTFLGRVASNHTSFIRIHTNKFIGRKQFLILPVEVEVSSEPGLFADIDQLDFGTLRRMDEPKVIVVSLMNTGNKPVSLTEFIVDPPNKAITIDVKTPVIKHSHQYVKAFVVTYTASNAKTSKQHLGKVVIKSTSKNSPRLEINYQANVLQGTLGYSVSKTRFFIGSPPYAPVVREIIITNTFTFPLVIHRVVVSSDIQDLFSVVNFSSPVIVQEQKTVTPFSILFSANKSISTLTSSIRVYTNASIFTIPITCYDGKLELRLPVSRLDLGTLAVTQKHEKVVEIANPNPVEITFSKVVSNNSLARITRIDGRDNMTIFSESTDEVTVKPGRLARFLLEIDVPHVEGEYSGNITFNTTFETKIVMFSFKAASGRIEIDPENIVFSPSFPGQTQKIGLFLKSTFINPVNVVSAMVEIQDKYFSFVPIKKSNAQLTPHNRQKIGDVVFDPGLLCSPRCYLGIEDNTWFKSFSLPAGTANMDTSLLDAFQAKWTSITETASNNFNSTLVIDTEAVKDVKATIKGGLVWPSLTSDRPVRFSLTHVGNVSQRTLTIINPADVPIVVQVVPLSVYPDAQSILDVLSDRFDIDLLTAKPSYHSCFSLPATKNNHYANMGKRDNYLSLESKLDVPTSLHTMSLIIGERSTINIPVQFKPENEDQRTSVILIRNNLTVLDVVTVQGQGARGELMINGKRPSVDSVLLFELKQRHLSDCTKLSQGSGGKPYRSLTVKKTVVATNPGQLPTIVTSFNIDGYECEGYGFKVLNCQSLSLKPAATAKIDIAFTPDFSVSRVSRRLQIKTALGSVFEFSLIATIPSEMIPLCAAAAGRPVWEFHVYISAIAVMICLLGGVLVVAHFEANKLIAINFGLLNTNTALLNGSALNSELFDLRKIRAPRHELSEISQTSEKDSSVNNRRPKRDILPEKAKLNNVSQTTRRNSNDSHERIVLNNNLIGNETADNENNKDKTRNNEASTKESAKKTKKPSTNQTVKRKDFDAEAPKPIVLVKPIVAPPVTVDEFFHPGVPGTSQNLPDSSSSETNGDFLNKKVKSKIRKKTAKVSPAIVPAKADNKDNNIHKVRPDEKYLEENSQKIKTDTAIKDGNKGIRKFDVSPKTQNNRHPEDKKRRVSLPESGKTKEDKHKSRQSSQGSTSEKKSNLSDKSTTNSSKKQPVTRHNSMPVPRLRKQISDNGENVDTPLTISETINSALEVTLKVSDSINQNSSSRSPSRCSSVSPSPPLSDSSQELSRSSSYSSVVGSEESAPCGNENTKQRNKNVSKNKKPTPLSISKSKDTTDNGSTDVRKKPNTGVCDGLYPWPVICGSSQCKTQRGPEMETFVPVTSSSSLFASTPFDKDVKLENRLSPTMTSPYAEEHNNENLYTFHDVKTPGLSTPFVEADSSVPKFWPDDPIPLESLVSKNQKRITNWVNFLDESSSGTSNLPSPGMPQSTKTMAEIWASGQHDENDGWSAAFSPSFDSELSPSSFPSFHKPYDTSWSTGVSHQSDYYGMPSENLWSAPTSKHDPQSEFHYNGQEANQFTQSFPKLNPLSKPWTANTTNHWSPATSYVD